MAERVAAMSAQGVLGQLKLCGVTHVVWLPDSETGFMYEALKASEFRLVPVCREGETMAIAAGLIMGGQRPVVLIQSTGFYESGDAIRGFCKDLKLPLLLMIGYRGYPGEGNAPRDSAAAMLEPMLKTWDIPYKIVSSEQTCHRVSECYNQAATQGRTLPVLMA